MSDGRPAGGGFPATRMSILEGLRAAETHDAALARLAEGYWRPAYRYLRLAWRLERADAEDLTQSFFAAVVERETLAGFDPARARLRTFLRVVLDRMVANWRRDGARQKRGGGATALRLDFDDAEGSAGLVPAAPDEPHDRVFHREWVRSLFDLALADLRDDARESGRGSQLRVFERYDLAAEDARPTYADLAAELGLPTTKVTNDLHAARKRFRRLLLARLRETCRDDDEWRDEARELLGIELP